MEKDYQTKDLKATKSKPKKETPKKTQPKDGDIVKLEEGYKFLNGDRWVYGFQTKKEVEEAVKKVSGKAKK